MTKIKDQLLKIGVPADIVNHVIDLGNGNLIHETKPFARVKFTEKGTPVFKFDTTFSLYNSFNELKQLRFVVLMGLNFRGDYIEDGIYEDLESINFKEATAKYSKTYLGDFDCVPLREQILRPTSIEDKVSRLKSKLSRQR